MSRCFSHSNYAEDMLTCGQTDHKTVRVCSQECLINFQYNSSLISGKSIAKHKYLQPHFEYFLTTLLLRSQS
ncbi:hypothetical protein IEQ34_003520 [Dendrobium chrysotoxum]|uniref:Uncharacterized protein n=1 Tax=Dendrobium chrysotoxum TaxID=161865 RepID=A0AAV7HJD6_DENCH|nr:hypothetical protein IEQ34_003520 [Dendrobium chrysotoxum]